MGLLVPMISIWSTTRLAAGTRDLLRSLKQAVDEVELFCQVRESCFPGRYSHFLRTYNQETSLGGTYDPEGGLVIDISKRN
jgi:hypothetical protein